MLPNSSDLPSNPRPTIEAVPLQNLNKNECTQPCLESNRLEAAEHWEQDGWGSRRVVPRVVGAIDR